MQGTAILFHNKPFFCPAERNHFSLHTPDPTVNACDDAFVIHLYPRLVHSVFFIIMQISANNVEIYLPKQISLSV